MRIKEIQLVNFRNYKKLTLYPQNGVNLFLGSNGTGKTNLLEAIHYCSLGKSHRINNDQNVVKIGENQAVCSIVFDKSKTHNTITIHLLPDEQQRKIILINQKKIHRFSDMMGFLQCVIFSPEDLSLIKDGPSQRRKYLDMMISQTNKQYFIALQQYKNALEQRNALLKQIKLNRSFSNLLSDFDNQMINPTKIIVSERENVINRLSEIANRIYMEISGQKDEEVLNISYNSSLKGINSSEDIFNQQLKDSREDDIRLGTTNVGPHRDDLHIALNRKNMKMFASQGQIRTAALSLKLSQIEIIKEIGGDDPVILLDDVMSELDSNRRIRLIDKIKEYQTFITCTDESDINIDLSKKIYQIKKINGLASVIQNGKIVDENNDYLSEPDFS